MKFLEIQNKIRRNYKKLFLKQIIKRINIKLKRHNLLKEQWNLENNLKDK